MPEQNQSFAFEKSLSELESLVQKMESGDLSLEQALKAFGQGVKLTRECQQALAQAEQTVQQLLENSGQLETKPFEQLEGE